MTDEGKSDHWADLASLLGATPPPEEPAAEKPPEPAPPPAAEPEPVEAPQASRTFVAPSGQRTAGDWGRLAESLGIAVPLEVPEPAPPEAQVVARTEAVEIPPPEEVPTLPPAVALESVDAELESVEVTDILPEGGGMAADLFTSVDTETGVAETMARGDRERPGRRRRKRRRRGRRPDDSPAAAASESPDVELELPEVGEEAEDPTAVQEAGDLSPGPVAESEEEGAERPRKRRRRRRRNGPRDERTAEPLEPADEPPELLADEDPSWTEPQESPAGEQEARAEEAGRAAEGEPSGEVSDLDDDVERAVHHGIPTWQEAVGIVIAANVESRAKNPGSPRNRGGRGRSGRS
jgi:hypothetical protein